MSASDNKELNKLAEELDKRRIVQNSYLTRGKIKSNMYIR
jgi:hypothetical protein